MSTNTMDEFALNVGQNFPWHELYVNDADQAVAFYSEALGFESEVYDMPDGTRYQMMKRGGRSICGVFPTNQPEMGDVPPHWAVYLAVDDVDQRLEKCISLGAKLVVGPMDVPSVGRMVLIQDPQGAHLWLYREAPQQ